MSEQTSAGDSNIDTASDAATATQPAQATTPRPASAATTAAVNLNTDPVATFGPLRGFGRLWQKTYQVALVGTDLTPTQVIATWKEHFASFWPPDDHFYTPLTGIRAGEFADVDLSLPGGGSLSTGVLVIDADDVSFTLLTPPDHIFAGWITFSSAVGITNVDQHPQPTTHARAQVLMRANDPLFELGLACGGHRREDNFWSHTLTQLARHLGVPEDAIMIETRNVCIDRQRQWRRATNLRHNSLLRAPARALGSIGRRTRYAYDQHQQRRNQTASATHAATTQRDSHPDASAETNVQSQRRGDA